MDTKTRRRLSRQQKRDRRRSTNVFANLSQEKISLYKETFSMIDQDGDGAISIQDLKSVLTSLGADDISEEVLQEMLMQCSGTLNFTAFLAMFAQMTSEMDDPKVIEDAFSILDDGNGRIDVSHFSTMLSTVGYERLSQDEVNGIIKKAPIEEDDMIDLKQMAKILTFQDE